MCSFAIVNIYNVTLHSTWNSQIPTWKSAVEQTTWKLVRKSPSDFVCMMLHMVAPRKMCKLNDKHSLLSKLEQKYLHCTTEPVLQSVKLMVKCVNSAPQAPAKKKVEI